MPSETCPREEDVLRAILDIHFDPNSGEISSSLFRGSDLSVSRLSVLPLEDIVKLFWAQLHDPPTKSLVKAGQVNVGEMMDLAVANGRLLVVEVDKTEENPAHARIPEQKNKSLARKILKIMRIHDCRKPDG